MNTILNSIILTLVITLFFLLFRNKSQIGRQYAIPVVVSTILWYIDGNWDENNMLSLSNIVYWILIMLLSYIIILIQHYFKLK
jgi:hypothetical protein